MPSKRRAQPRDPRPDGRGLGSKCRAEKGTPSRARSGHGSDQTSLHPPLDDHPPFKAWEMLGAGWQGRDLNDLGR